MPRPKKKVEEKIELKVEKVAPVIVSKPLLKVQETFANKVIVHGFKNNDELKQFMKFFITQTWVSAKIPLSNRNVKTSETPTVEQLNKQIKLDDVVDNALKRKALIMERVVPVFMGLRIKINSVEKATNPYIGMEIDKFLFESETTTRNLNKFVKEVVNKWTNE